MKILQIAPICLPLAPDLKYGGIERVVLALARCFTENGHQVINAASGDSAPYGELLKTIESSEWSKPEVLRNERSSYEEHITKVIDFLSGNKVDVVHDHTGNFVLSDSFKERIPTEPVLRKVPIVVTPHELKRFLKREPPKNMNNIYFTALSHSQRQEFSRYVPIHKVIHNGVFVADSSFVEGKEDFLFSLGSIEYDKGQDLAVRVSQKMDLPLVIGGKVAEEAFFNREIRPFLGDKIKYVDELNDKEKDVFYASARAFLALIRIPDCFSLTRIEALACGTPVITLDKGSAREAVEPGKTGYVVEYHKRNEEKVVEEIVEAVQKINLISNKFCRKAAEERFDWRNIAQEYLGFYQSVNAGV